MNTFHASMIMNVHNINFNIPFTLLHYNQCIHAELVAKLTETWPP